MPIASAITLDGASTFTLARCGPMSARCANGSALVAAYRHQGRGRAVPITFDDDMPSLEGRIDGVTGLIALDTGNSSTMVVQSVWARKHGLAERLKRGIETVSYGGASRNWASRIATLEIGDTVLKRSIVRYAEDKVGAFSSR